MKTLRILIFALLATVTVARGQTFSIAETNTPEIQALARGLQNDPLRIFDYVHDHIKYVFYYGSKKGAQLTLSEGSGNDFDQCALLVALLNAAGYANTSYKYETVDIPYDATDGTHNDLHHWLQLSLVNTNWANTTGYFNYLTATQQRNFPYVTYLTGDTNTIVLPHVWVLLTIGSTTYNLDPSFKVSEPVAGINLTAALGYGNVANLSNALMNAAGGTVTTNYVQSLSESSLRSALQNCNSNLLAVLQNNYETSSVLQILGGQQIIPWTNGLSLSQTFAPYYDQIDYPPQTWTYLPTNYMATFGIAFCGVTNSWYFPALQGRRLSLTFNSTGLGQLWLDDSLIFQTNTGPYIDANKKVSVGFICTFPPNYGNNFAKWAEYDPTNSSYAILYAFEPEPKRLHERQQILDTYIQEGFTNNSRQVLTETLNVMGLNWMTQTKLLGDDILGQQMGMSPEWEVRLGRAAEESGNGYYIDAYCQLDREEPNSGITAADQQRYAQYFDLKNYFGSAMEHSIIEQLQSSNLVGASTVKILQLANTNKNAIYLANITNWSAVSSQLTGYASAAQSAISAAIANGDYLLLPANGSVAIAGTGSWAGAGYVDLSPSLTSRSISMLLGGGYNGGFSAFPSSAIDSSYVQSFNFSQPFYLNLVPPSVTVAVGADPVSMADAAFKVATPDLSIGQAEPMGITFTRYYSPTYRHLNLANMGYGWVNSYYMNLATVSAPETSLGGNTPAQMAPILTAAWAAANLYNTTPSAKNWLVTALIAKWGIDQTINNAVSVTLGNNVLQFIKQPDGSFTPPANCNWSLTNKPTYILQERHGNTFTFNATKQLTGITNQYGVGLALTYSGTNVSTVTDWKGRAFTFTYSGSPARLTQVADATGRSVKYGYATNVDQKLDLVLVTDPEGKTNSFQYDTNHQIVATVDALGRLVVSNVYDSFGHVTTQYTQGDPNKTWQIYWSGWETVSQDPAGGQQSYFYDDQSRLIAQEDALGNVNQTIYDGQNRVEMTISPMNETNQFIYDSNNNLLYSIDALGFANQLIYDGQNNLIRALDPLGKPATFGYNTNFSLTGQTNGAGDWVNYSYNSNGTLATRTDAGGITTNGYDSYGQLNSIGYPGGLGSESLVNSYYGDVTNHTDARGFATGFQYNNRRQLTNSIAPTNVTVSISFDAVGNVASVTDARTNTTSKTWSATRHLLMTTLPTTPQGVPIVTNGYDVRDWLTVTVDPLKNPSLYTNDYAGRLISVTDPVSRTTSFGYDFDGRKLTSVNAASETNSQTWDGRGSLIRLTDGAGHFSLRTYDAAGNQIILTNRNGKPWQFFFDQANRLTNTVTPKGHSTILVFNHQGLASKIINQATNTTSLYYDGKGRLTNRMDTWATNFYTYDGNDNPTSVIEGTKTNFWTYDAYNHVSTYKDVNGYLIQYRNDANGNVVNLTYPGNKTVTNTYDNLNRLATVTDWSGRKSTITYDLDSHVTGIKRPNGSYRTISFDAAGQATNIYEQMANSLPIAIFKFNWTNSGSMAWEFAAPLPHSSTVPTRNMTYDDDNRLYQFQGPSTGGYQNVGVDSNGNLINGPLTNDTFVAYAFDARNRLSNAGGVTNVYDALNNRIGQTFGTNTTTFVVNPNAKLPQVLMRIKNGVTNYYIYGAGLLYQITEAATGTTTLTYHYDYRGSTIALSADSGLVTDRIEYSAYGLTTYRVGTNDTPFLFNGRYGVQSDSNGLLYMRARHYNPYLCRFVSQDPSGFSGGLNWFAYANGNPVSYLDPFGLGAIGENSGSSWVMNGLQATASDIGNGLLNSPNAAANVINSAVMQGGNAILAGFGMVGAVQQTILSAVGVDDPAELMALPGGGAVGEEIAVLEDAGAMAAGGISDSALVVRGGQNLPQNFLTGSGVSVSESGILDGVSVQSAHGVDLETLSQSIPHNQVGVTTVGDIRSAGGNVIPSPTPYNPYHSILSGIDADTASGLFRPTIPNPAKP